VTELREKPVVNKSLAFHQVILIIRKQCYCRWLGQQIINVLNAFVVYIYRRKLVQECLQRLECLFFSRVLNFAIIAQIGRFFKQYLILRFKVLTSL
jgi:hypothetical protein